MCVCVSWSSVSHQNSKHLKTGTLQNKLGENDRAQSSVLSDVWNAYQQFHAFRFFQQRSQGTKKSIVECSAAFSKSEFPPSKEFISKLEDTKFNGFGTRITLWPKHKARVVAIDSSSNRWLLLTNQRHHEVCLNDQNVQNKTSVKALQGHNKTDIRPTVQMQIVNTPMWDLSTFEGWTGLLQTKCT